MRKKSVRLASAALAVCMMLSALPVGAFAAEPGEETENGVNAQDISAAQSGDDIAINETNFPDPIFREFVKQYDTTRPEDNKLSKSELAAVTTLDCSNRYDATDDVKIKRLKGIEYFTSLERLDCRNNLLTELDVSKNTALTYLDCYSNQLTELDVSDNTALTTLKCWDNQLTKLQLTKPDAGNNTALTWLECGGNQLAELDVRDNKVLRYLFCSENQLTKLDVSQNTKLEILQCFKNQLTSLDLKNTNLKNADGDADAENLAILAAEENSYNIAVDPNNRFDLSTLPGGFDVSKVKEGSWIGGTVSGGILTVDEGVDKVTYTYDCGITQRGKHCLVMFTLNVNPVDIPEDGGDTDAAADNIKGALSAIVVGAVAGAIIYETGTGIYRVINMPGIAMPSNRGELAMLLWEHAGKPEPVNTALYSDITEDDIDLNKAARWAVEQDLMQDNSEKNTFNPRFPVSKLRTCLTWNAAKEKGLFDTDKTAE